MAKSESRDSRSVLARILDTPHLAKAVPSLPPEALHRMIQRFGLEDCGDIVALATTKQLAEIFDLDLWRADQPGRDEQFDPARFGEWLNVLVDNGAEFAAQKLAALDLDLLVTAFAQHLRVFDPVAMSMTTDDGDQVQMIRLPDNALTCEVGGYLVVAKRDDAWDAIVDVLASLAEEHAPRFRSVMNGCRGLSNSTPELDGLDDLMLDPDQAMFDLAVDREQRREQKGYVTPAQAQAFLQAARQLDLQSALMPPDNVVARAYFSGIESGADAELTQVDTDGTAAADGTAAEDNEPQPPDPGEILDVLRDAGIVSHPARALLEPPAGEPPRFGHVRESLQRAHAIDPALYLQRSAELAYLANVIIAGTSIQARPFTSQEAADAVAAVCNLGLENWPSRWTSDGHDFVRAFEVGWTCLYRKVCLPSAERLLAVVADLRCRDRDTQAGLDDLARELRRHLVAGAPWRARDALDVLAGLDLPAWAALLALLDECPVIHAALTASLNASVRAVDPTGFEFISGNRQLEVVHRFLRVLPDRLVG